MPGRIVTETCPAPECTLTVAEIEQFLPELTSYLGLLAGSFVHQSQWAWCGVYLQGIHRGSSSATMRCVSGIGPTMAHGICTGPATAICRAWACRLTWTVTRIDR